MDAKCRAVAWLGCLGFALATPALGQVANHPILFVAQVPMSEDFGNAFSTFGNHGATIDEVPRGGDLMIRYPDGTLRNLTREAGFGSVDAFQGAEAIAVRDPDVHWSGTRALFSMVVGAPPQQFQRQPWVWQMYEVTGLAQGQVAVITRVPNQPPDYNNVSPAYASAGRLIFGSDRPRSGERHLYPQHDEYESAPTATGVWRLDPASGDLRLLQHSPSGSFDPIVDSFGRVLFTRWDHLQTDQQAEADAALEAANLPSEFGTFDYASEDATAARLPRAPEIFPEPRLAIPGSGLGGHRFNFFFPWTVHQDGSEEETLNHVGRHELQGFFARSFEDDPDLVDHDSDTPRTNPNEVENTFQLAEDPNQPGRYVAIDTPEFATHASGQLLRIDAPPGRNADTLVVEYLTPRSTFGVAPLPGHSGRYRNPIVLGNGAIVAAHTPDTGIDAEQGSASNPDPRYDFRLRFVVDPDGDGTHVPGAALTAGIVRSVDWFSPDVLIEYDGPLWELSPVEVRARPEPPTSTGLIATPEQQVFASAAVDIETFRDWMRDRDLALVVMRNTTRRDRNDEQQPYNLFVPGGVSSVAAGAQSPRAIDAMQFLQADQIRGRGTGPQPRAGRRPIARPLSDAAALAANPVDPAQPAGTHPIAADGSVALFVPTRRALSWQALAPDDTPVVRERFWLTFQPGEIRACDGCHGVNTLSHDGQPAADNASQALVDLLAFWKQQTGIVFASGFESEAP